MLKFSLYLSILLLIIYLASSYDGWPPSDSQSFKLERGQAALIKINSLGKKQNLIATINGKQKTLVSSVDMSFDQPFYYLINPSKLNTQSVVLKVMGSDKRSTYDDLKLEYSFVDKDKYEYYQEVFSHLTRFNPKVIDIMEVASLFKLLEAPYFNNHFSEYVQQQLAIRAIEAKNWTLSIHLLRKIKTYTQQRLLLQCQFLDRYLRINKGEFSSTELEEISELAVLLYYVALSQKSSDSSNTQSNATQSVSVKKSCSPILNSTRIVNAKQKILSKDGNGNNSIGAYDAENTSNPDSEEFDSANYKSEAGLLFELVVENLPELDSPNIGYILSNLWFLFNFYGLHGDAIEVAKLAINKFESSKGNQSELIELYNNIFTSLRRESRFAEARFYTQKGSELKAFIGPEKFADILFNKGILYADLGEFESAIRYFERSIEQVETDLDQLQWTAQSCSYKGRFQHHVAANLVKIASVKSELGETTEAQKFFVCAGKLLKDIGGYYCIVLHSELARFAYLNNKYDEALWHVEQLLQRSSNSVGKPNIALPSVAKDAPRPVNKIEALTIQLAIDVVRNQNLLSSIVSCDIKSESADTRCELAELIGYETFYDEAILANNNNYLIQQIRIFTQLIILHGHLQQPKWVELFSRKSLALIKSTKSEVINLQAWNAARFEFVETFMEILIRTTKNTDSVDFNKLHQVLETYYSLNPSSEKNLFSIPVQNNDKDDEAIRKILIQSIRHAVFDILQPELQLSKEDILKDKYSALDNKTQSSLTTNPVLSLADLQSRMAESELLVRFFSTGTKTYSLLISKTSTTLHTHQDTARITKLVSESFGYLSFNHKDQQKLRELFVALFPTEVLAQHKFKRLIIIPDGNLHRLPFSILNIAKQQNRFIPLSSQYEMVRTPSASTYYGRPQTQNLALKSFDISVFANPIIEFTSAEKHLLRGSSKPQFSALPGTLKEAEFIRQIFASSKHTIKLGEDATSTFLKSAEARNSTLLHIATHGYYNSTTPDIVGLITSSDEKSGLPGVLSFFDLLTKPVSANLIVMSGCETMLGKNYKGSGMRSMTRGFLAQGAGSVISTLWPVQDRATAEFMKLFYQQLKNTKNSSKALHKAKRTMSSSGRFRHPKHWAGFVLTSMNQNFENIDFL